MKAVAWRFVGLAMGTAVAWAGEVSFGPGMAGRFVQQSGGRTRGVLEVGTDGQVVWSADGGAAVWRGRLSGPDEAELYSLDLETEGAPRGVAMMHDPIAPAWAIAGIRGQASKRLSIQREGEMLARTRDAFKNRFVLDAPYDADCTAEAEARLVGTWANFAEGFGLHALFLSSNHLGMAFGDSGAAGMKWRALRVDGEWRVLAEIFEGSASGKAVVFLMGADLRKESLVRLGAAASEAEVLANIRDGVEDRERWEFHRVLDAVPEEWERRIAGIPAAVERERAEAAVRERAKRAERGRLERERPRQEEVLRALRLNPAALLDVTFPLYGKDERAGHRSLEGLPCDSPELRAVNEALADASIPFAEEVLMAFLEKQPTVGHWRFFRPVFDRDELGPEARRRIAPKIMGTGNYDDACVFFNHPNTPMDVLLEAEKDPGLPGGVADCLRRRLKREERQ